MTTHHRKRASSSTSSTSSLDERNSLKDNAGRMHNDSTVPSRLASDVSDDNGTLLDEYDSAKGRIGSKAAAIETEPLSSSSSSSRRSSMSSMVVSRSWNTWTTHLSRIFTEFQHNGLPWEGQQCRSIQAGCSGILFSGGALFISNDARILQVAWALQGIFSVLADYVYVPYTSVWHGIDRISATLLLLVTCVQVMQSLAWWMIFIGIFPVGCFVQAAHAKQEGHLRRWHVWHCAWHIVAGSVVMFLMYLLYQYCPNKNSGAMDDLSSNQSIMEEWFGRPACQSKNSVIGNIVGWWESSAS